MTDRPFPTGTADRGARSDRGDRSDRSDRSDRGVSTVLNYALVLGIATLLVSGLLLSANTFVSDQQERVIRSELTVVGNHVAADLATADRLAQRVDGSGTVRATVALPEHVSGSTYRLRIERPGGSGPYELTLLSTAPEVSVTVLVRSRTDIATGTVGGGDVVVAYDPAAGVLEVTNADR